MINISVICRGVETAFEKKRIKNNKGLDCEESILYKGIEIVFSA